jgi:hypothetical protein
MVTVSILFLIESEFSADYYDYEKREFSDIDQAFNYIDTIKAGCVQHAEDSNLPPPTWKTTYTDEEIEDQEYLDVTYLHSSPVYRKLTSSNIEQTYLVAVDVQFDSQETKLKFFQEASHHQDAFPEVPPKLIWPLSRLH